MRSLSSNSILSVAHTITTHISVISSTTVSLQLIGLRGSRVTTLSPSQGLFKSMKPWIASDYDSLKKTMFKYFTKGVIEQRRYTTAFLKSYNNILRTERDDIPNYCRTYNGISQHCMKKEGLAKQRLQSSSSMGCHPLCLRKRSVSIISISRTHLQSITTLFFNILRNR